MKSVLVAWLLMLPLGARAQEIAPAQAQPWRHGVRGGQDAPFHFTLRKRLRQRRKLLVGDKTGRQRHFGLQTLAHARTDAKRAAIFFHLLLLNDENEFSMRTRANSSR